jgi:ribonuclease Z
LAIDPDSSACIFDNFDVTVSTIPLEHRIPCTGFKFAGKKRLPKMIKEKVDELHIPIENIPLIKKGFAFTDQEGVIHPSTELTTESEKPKAYAYCSDTICNWKYLDLIADVDMLYHEATFMHDMIDRATETFHTTALQAAEIAVKAGAKQLLIGHFSARYRDLDPVLMEAKSVFPETFLATEGSTFNL